MAKHFISSSHRPSTIQSFFFFFFYLFPYSFFFLSISLHPKSGVFEMRVKATKKYVFICTHQGLFFPFIYFHSPSSACCGQETKSDGFIHLHLDYYNSVMAQTQLGLRRYCKNQAIGFISRGQTRQVHNKGLAGLQRNVQKKRKECRIRLAESNTAEFIW